MNALFKYELKSNIKALLIWALAVGGMGLLCIILYSSMETSMEEMAESMASMGALSDAFGMSTLSIATLKGYFATEIGAIHSLGSSMFAASIAAVVLSKEEDNHTAEFTFTLPATRIKVIIAKYASILINIAAFTVICAALYIIGFVSLGEELPAKEFFTFMGLQLMMNLEIAAICFMLSACSKKNRLGIGISLAMILYAFDIVFRVIPDMKDVMFITPFSYSNASQIFSNADLDISAVTLSVIVIIGLTALSAFVYNRRDLAS